MVDSLRLRETTTDTSLRSTTGEAGLRSDAFVVQTSVAQYTSLTATLTDYDVDSSSWTVSVRWVIDEDVTDTVPGSGSVITEAQVNWSWDGPPEFWTDGATLFTQTTGVGHTSPYVLTGVTHDTEMGQPHWSQSHWMYFSMFYRKLDSNGDTFVERVATTTLLIPTYYNMAATLFDRIPRYYRALDDVVSVAAPNPLERYLSVFGWEADYFRSLIDELMLMNDPYRVHYSSLTNLAKGVGLRFTATELRPAQMRELIYDSDRYFDRKGRTDALIDMLSVLSDSEVSAREFNPTGAAAAAYRRIKFVVTASRLNLITNPRFVGAPSTSGTWNVLTNATAGSITVDHSAATGVTLTTDGSGAGTAYLFPRKTVQVKRSLTYYTSVEGTLTNATARVRLYREEPTSASSLPPQSTYFTTDHSAGTDFYKTLTLRDVRYHTSKIAQKSGYELSPGTAETHAVYIVGSTPVNGSLFRARLYTDTDIDLSAYTLKLTRVDANPSSGSRFDRFDLAVHSGSADVLTANNLTVNTSSQVVDEDTSAVVTKLTNTTGGIAYTLLVDDVATITYAATTQLPSDDTSTYEFRTTGVEQLFPVIEVTLANNSSVTLDKWIFQPFSDHQGTSSVHYFDGSSRDGFSHLSSGSILSDYYWSGAANDSVSLFTPIRTRNRAAIRKALLHNLPLTMSAELTSANYPSATQHGHLIAFDATPGDESAFDPHSWTANVYTEGVIQSNTD